MECHSVLSVQGLRLRSVSYYKWWGGGGSNSIHLLPSLNHLTDSKKQLQVSVFLSTLNLKFEARIKQLNFA